MALGDGTHKLPVKSEIRRLIRKRLATLLRCIWKNEFSRAIESAATLSGLPHHRARALLISPSVQLFAALMVYIDHLIRMLCGTVEAAGKKCLP
jgi:hypothetical protein